MNIDRRTQVMTSVTADQKFKIQRILSDAGCDETLIERFLELEAEGKKQEQYRMLSRHKMGLLKNLHLEQNRIDCLDHMVYAMKEADRQ